MNVIFKLPLSIRILLALTVVLSLWLIFRDDDEPQRQLKEVDNTSDYTMTDFNMTIINTNGEPAYIIKGKELTHYPDNDSAEIIQPFIEFLKSGQNSWIVKSEQGYSQGESETLLLTGNVIISDQNDAAFEMRTEKLTLNMQDNTAYTQEAVLISSPQGVTEAIGLHAVLDEKTINLHSRIKGQYNAPTN